MSQEELKIIGKECRFGVHIPTKDPNQKDATFVKEQLHMSDGTILPKMRMIVNYKRPLYVTKVTERNHKEKKEFEHVDKLMFKEVTQSDLRYEVAKLLDKPWSRESLRELSDSPYLYGTDISSTTHIKKREYMEKYPGIVSPYTVAMFDTETDMVRGDGQIIIASACFRNKVIIAVDQICTIGYASPESFFRSKCKDYLQEYIDTYKLEIEFHLEKDEISVVKRIFNRIHEWRPDWLAIWTMDFDIPKVFDACERSGTNPKDIFCDPSIPKEFQVCKYKQGQKKKVAASGKVMPINPAMQWHTLFCTSSFYVIDAMCVYKQIRMSQQEEPSYSLDAILTKELDGLTKMKFDKAQGYVGARFHSFMQSTHIFEYMVYNIFDSFAMLLLDNKTQDLEYTLPSFAAATDFHDFKSQPKRIRDALYFFALEKYQRVLGTVGPSQRVEEEKEKVATEYEGENEEGDLDEVDENGDPIAPEDSTLGRTGWVVTLPSHMSVLGLPLIEEDPTIKTGIRAFTYDSDAVLL